MQHSFNKAKLKIGTRGSPLALYQARLVQNHLAQAAGLDKADAEAVFPICIYKTSGDKLQGDLSEFGGKGLFTKELEDRLDSGAIDIAVHSMKDVPTSLRKDHIITAVLKREDPRDVFISATGDTLQALPKGALIGTASLRRRAQLAAMRPDLRFTLLRGNVGTRLKKLQAGECDGTLLALAGLKRLGQGEVATEIIDAPVMLNAPAQGAIGIETLSSNLDAVRLCAALDHRDSHLAILAERAFLKALDGSCRVPIAALAHIKQGKIYMQGELLSDDGQQRWRREGFIHKASPKTAKELGDAMGHQIKAEVGRG